MDIELSEDQVLNLIATLQTPTPLAVQVAIGFLQWKLDGEPEGDD